MHSALDVASLLCYSPLSSLGGRVVLKKQQTDKRQTETSVSCPFFYAKEECSTDLLNGKIKPLHFKHLSAAFDSAMITSVHQDASSFPRAFAMWMGQTVSECRSESCLQSSANPEGT